MQKQVGEFSRKHIAFPLIGSHSCDIRSIDAFRSNTEGCWSSIGLKIVGSVRTNRPTNRARRTMSKGDAGASDEATNPLVESCRQSADSTDDRELHSSPPCTGRSRRWWTRLPNVDRLGHTCRSSNRTGKCWPATWSAADCQARRSVRSATTCDDPNRCPDRRPVVRMRRLDLRPARTPWWPSQDEQSIRCLTQIRLPHRLRCVNPIDRTCIDVRTVKRWRERREEHRIECADDSSRATWTWIRFGRPAALDFRYDDLPYTGRATWLFDRPNTRPLQSGRFRLRLADRKQCNRAKTADSRTQLIVLIDQPDYRRLIRSIQFDRERRKRQAHWKMLKILHQLAIAIGHEANIDHRLPIDAWLPYHRCSIIASEHDCALDSVHCRNSTANNWSKSTCRPATRSFDAIEPQSLHAVLRPCPVC